MVIEENGTRVNEVLTERVVVPVGLGDLRLQEVHPHHVDTFRSQALGRVEVDAVCLLRDDLAEAILHVLLTKKFETFQN